VAIWFGTSSIGDNPKFSHLSQIVVGVSGFLLLLGVAVDRLIMTDPPSRFKDFSFYVGQHTDRLQAILVDKSNPQQWRCYKTPSIWHHQIYAT